ncbi:MAG: DUF6600 domain-containing protein, partial [Acidobacteriota bacterium]
ALNAPLMQGDTLSVSPGGAVEFQLDFGSFARLAGDSEIRISDFETGRVQLQLAKGLVTYRVLRQTSGIAEISTPLAAVRPLGLASVRIEVAPDGSTRVTVRHGEVEVDTQRGAERVREGNMMLIKGTADDPEFQVVSAPAHDPWDTWNDQRDAYLLRAQSPRYVSQDIYGSEDLDNNGRWSYDPAYGNVWAPNVPATWAPYQDGRWVWEDYYGWTWVDAAPWGWAPFHYGSWYLRTGFGWCWFPGHRNEHYWYRPALVSFFGFGGRGGFGVGFGFGNVGWIPLAPYERFRPWYGRGWGGGRNVGVNINIVHNANIFNSYRNARVNNGVTAVSGADFQRGNFRNRVAVGGQQLQQASLVRGAVPLTPGSDHLRFSDRQAAAGPRADLGNQRFFGRMPASAGNSSRVPFSQQQSNMRSALENRGLQAGGASTQPGRGFGAAAQRQNTAPGWQRFGNPQATQERQFNAPAAQQGNPRQAAPNSNGARFGGSFGGQTRSLEVAPPIVRQRQPAPAPSRQPAPNYNAPSPGGRQYYNAPAYRAPSGNAPAYRGGGGGGNFGSPAYRSAPSAPSNRSAPAPSYRGGGGGGGGHSNSGGHGGRR